MRIGILSEIGCARFIPVETYRKKYSAFQSTYIPTGSIIGSHDSCLLPDFSSSTILGLSFYPITILCSTDPYSLAFVS